MRTTLINEIVYYGDGAAWVTSQRLVVGGTTYWLSDISSVEEGKVAGQRWAQARFNWNYSLIPLALIMVTSCFAAYNYAYTYFTLLILAGTLVSVFAWHIWKAAFSKPTDLSRQAPPVHVIKLTYKGWAQIVFISLDENYTKELATLVGSAARASWLGYPTPALLQDKQLMLPRGTATSPAITTYFMDGLACVTSEVVHVGRDSYPLRGVRAVYVHTGNVEWYKGGSATGYFVVLNIDGTHRTILATTDQEYANQVKSAIKQAMSARQGRLNTSARNV